MSTQLETVRQTAVKREEAFKKSKGLEKTVGQFLKGNFPKYEGRSCIPPTVKQGLLTRLRSDIDSRAKKLEEGIDPAKQQDVIKRLHTSITVIGKIPNCSPERTGEAIQQTLDTYQKDVDELIGDVIEDRRTRKLEQATKKSQSIKKKIESGADLNEVEKVQGMGSFLKEWWQEIFLRLGGYAYDGAEAGKQAVVASPCSLHVNLGKGKREPIQAALDKLAFLGSRNDWVEYYVNGNTDILSDDGTFQPLHKDDWPGCFEELYRGVIIPDDKNISEKLKQRGLEKKMVKNLDLLPSWGYDYGKTR